MKYLLGKDQIAGLFLIALAAVYYYLADVLPRSLVSDRVGAAGFPKLLAAALIVFSLILIAQAVIRQRLQQESEEDQAAHRSRFQFLNASGMLGIGIGYLLIVSWVGYTLGIALLILAALRYQGEPLSKKVVLTAVLGGIFFWAFFVFALKTPMPAGIWSAILAGR